MEPKTGHLFYVLECSDGSYYGGYTTDLNRRVDLHNAGKGAKYTRAKGPVRCIHSEPFTTKREAMQAEYRFKQLTRAAKERYLRQQEAEQ
ncbi:MULTISPECIES: GIY-YIG nuclease family protein [Sporosarcina]|uniref:GIY-YIG nuclease family protein n=1 Tax=Sporosarcina TaxID=1569 RepID=UPI00058E135C|nr:MULTISPECIES: GIY-YIG nuclease family protein [Sporosarcina]WJY26743.1 GIY-YIG nuclease family protein [Sporosarcina sp. 0.2-SM1T-5]